MIFMLKTLLQNLKRTGQAQRRKTAGQLMFFCLLLAACGGVNRQSGSPAGSNPDWKQPAASATAQHSRETLPQKAACSFDWQDLPESFSTPVTPVPEPASLLELPENVHSFVLLGADRVCTLYWPDR